MTYQLISNTAMKLKICIMVSFTICLLLIYNNSNAQDDNRVVTSGASFLLLSPDAKNAGVAEAGTGLKSGVNALFVNPAKLLFSDDMGLSLSYTPWMRSLTRDSHLGYLSAFRKISENEAIGTSIKYLDMGYLNFRDDAGVLLQQYKANEFSFDVTYARKLGINFGMALTARYFRSDLGKGNFNGLELKPANAFAADISIYSEKEFESGRYSRGFSWGINLSNIGTKIKYSQNEHTFLPMNLRAGAGYTLFMNPENSLTLLIDINKLMIPTPPRFKKDINGDLTDEIEKGKDPNRSVSSALFTSLFDAPGGFREELSEFTVAGGFEFSFYKKLFLRTGYFYEDPNKGNRQHFATGVGFAAGPIQFDFSYLIPTANRFALKNTTKFTLSYAPTLNKRF